MNWKLPGYVAIYVWMVFIAYFLVESYWFVLVLSGATLLLIYGLLTLRERRAVQHVISQGTAMVPIHGGAGSMERTKTDPRVHKGEILPPERFDEQIITSDLMKLASSPGLVEQYVTKAKLKFRLRRQQEILDAAAIYIWKKERFIRAQAELDKALAQRAVTPVKRDAVIADLQAETAEANLRRARAEKEMKDLGKGQSEPEKLQEAVRIAGMEAEIAKANLVRLEAERKAARLGEDDRSVPQEREDLDLP